MIQKPNAVIKITPSQGQTDQQAVAEALINMPIQSTITVTSFLQEPFNDCLNELAIEQARQIEAVNKSDMRNVEGLLAQQAYTLDVIFNRLLQRANDQEYLDNFQDIAKLALRAQNQCRATLETLGAIKNPANVAFVRQANIAHNQQVNNGISADPPAGQSTGIHSDPQLEHTHGNYLDTGTTATAIRNDQDMATVGESHRPEDRRRKS